MQTTRRELLGALCAATVGGIAGCQSGGGGGDSGDGSGDGSGDDDGGLGGQEQAASAPSVSLDFELEGSTLTILHAGGESINAENTGKLEVEAGGEVLATVGPDRFPIRSAGQIFSGEVSSGQTVQVVWYAPGGGDSQILADYDVP